jgi:hypothetical protein
VVSSLVFVMAIVESLGPCFIGEKKNMGLLETFTWQNWFDVSGTHLWGVGAAVGKVGQVRRLG